MNDCPFCAIARKKIEAVIIWEDADLVAFLDRSPIREGHCQIVPKEHYETFERLPPDIAARIIALGQKLARRMKEVYKVDRVAFIFTGGDVPHAHAHVFPIHEKNDVTSGRFIKNVETVQLSSTHLLADKESLEKTKAKLGSHFL